MTGRQRRERKKTQAEYDAETIASRQGFCRHYPSGGMGLNTKCSFGILFESITSEGGHYPCHDGVAYKHLCAHADHYTEQEAKDWLEDSRTHMRVHFTKIKEHVCPFCGQAFTPQQVGRCVYAEPCGHRLYQGTVPD